jgi:hypothetical protein
MGLEDDDEYYIPPPRWPRSGLDAPAYTTRQGWRRLGFALLALAAICGLAYLVLPA